MPKLTLERRKREAIVIDDGRIRIVIEDISGKKVKVSVEAELTTRVDREEVYLERKQLTGDDRED